MDDPIRNDEATGKNACKRMLKIINLEQKCTRQKSGECLSDTNFEDFILHFNLILLRICCLTIHTFFFYY